MLVADPAGTEPAMKLACGIIAALVVAVAQTSALRTYQDPQKRFEFIYPADFGAPSAGTDNGFRDRVAAIRFSEFSAGVRSGKIILGGEAVLTKESPQIDLQAAGGLYDEITLQIFPAPAASIVRSALPRLTAANFCGAIAGQRHMNPADPRLSALTPAQRTALDRVDPMGNASPRVLQCDVTGETVTFVKEAGQRYIYGAIRFLPQPYSSFQLVRGGEDAPAAVVLRQITDVVNAWRESR
jgi:hypothetical protein